MKTVAFEDGADQCGGGSLIGEWVFAECFRALSLPGSRMSLFP